MGMGLYDAAFAALARLYGIAARSPITSITLMAGFASTVGWPLTAWGLDHFGWRETCLGWALVHLLIGIPLNARLPNTEGLPAAEDMPEAPVLALDRTMWLLHSDGGPSAEASRLGWRIASPSPAGRHARWPRPGCRAPCRRGFLAATLHPLGAALLAFGAGAVPAFALLHGAGKGILTIARGSVPLAIYGPVNYGYRLGILGAPSRVAQAAAPLLFGVLIDAFGAGTFFFSAALGLGALAALCMVQR
jgi:hypothetical protein